MSYCRRSNCGIAVTVEKVVVNSRRLNIAFVIHLSRPKFGGYRGRFYLVGEGQARGFRRDTVSSMRE